MIKNERNAEQLTLGIFEELEKLVSQMRKSIENNEVNNESKVKLIEYMLHLVEELHKSEKKMVFWRSIAFSLITSGTVIVIMIVIIGYGSGN